MAKILTSDVPRVGQDWRVAQRYVSAKKAPPPVEMKLFSFHSAIFEHPDGRRQKSRGWVPSAMPSPPTGAECRGRRPPVPPPRRPPRGQPTIGRSAGQLRSVLYDQLGLSEFYHLSESRWTLSFTGCRWVLSHVPFLSPLSHLTAYWFFSLANDTPALHL